MVMNSNVKRSVCLVFLCFTYQVLIDSLKKATLVVSLLISNYVILVLPNKFIINKLKNIDYGKKILGIIKNNSNKFTENFNVKNFSISLLVFLFFCLSNNSFAQISQRGSSTSTSGSGTSIVITKPTGVVSGDVLFASFSLYDGSGVNSSSYNPSCSGWTLVDGRILSGSSSRRAVLLYKVATGSEGASYTFTFSSVGYIVGEITAFSGADVSGATPFDVTPGTISNGTVTTNSVSATSITTLTDNSAVLLFGFESYNGYSFSSWSNTSPGSLTELVDAKYATWASVGLSWGIKGTAGSTGAGTFTLSGSSTTSCWGAIQIALKVAGSCSAPSSLTTSSVAQTTCTASWTAPGSAPANGYQWEVRTSGAGGSGATGLTASGTTGAGVVSVNVTGLTANTTYYLYVRSDCGSSNYSSWASSSSFKTVPVNVTGFTCSTVSSSSISCSWTAVTGAYGYYVLIDQNASYSGDFSGASIVYDPTVTKTFTSLSPTTTYYVHITAFNTDWAWNGYTHTSGCTTTAETETWVGGTSTNWNTASNWSGNYVPLSTTDVTIPSGTTYSPSIGSTITAVCKSLTINASATLTIGNTSAGGGSFSIYGNVTNNGNIYHTSDLNTNLYGTSNTFGGTGNFTYNNEFVSFVIQSSANYTLSSNVTMLNQIRISSSGTFNLSTYTISIYTLSFDAGTINLNTGTMEIGNAINYTSGTLNVNTGTINFNSGATVWTNYGYTAASQTINSFTYYNLIVRTNNGYTATFGDGSTVVVSNDLTIQNPSTAGGTASTSYDVTVGNNFYLGNSGNALNLNMSNRIYRASGTGTFTMGNVSGHIINISYADATNYAISGFSSPTFYGTVIYNSASAQKVISATSYQNLTCSGASTKTLYAAIDINGVLTLNAGTFDVGSNYAVTLGGDFVRASGAIFSAQNGTITFDGSSTQVINVTSAGGTTPTNSDITFYNVVVANSDCRFYCDKTNSRKFNMTDFTINSSKKCSFYSN